MRKQEKQELLDSLKAKVQGEHLRCPHHGTELRIKQAWVDGRKPFVILDCQNKECEALNGPHCNKCGGGISIRTYRRPELDQEAELKKPERYFFSCVRCKDTFSVAEGECMGAYYELKKYAARTAQGKSWKSLFDRESPLGPPKNATQDPAAEKEKKELDESVLIAKWRSLAEQLGRTIGNLQAIEMQARMAIAYLDAREKEATEKTQIPQLKKGDLVAVNILTNSWDMRQVLERYNKLAPSHRVDVDAIVTLRDNLAHGRVFMLGPMYEPRMNLIKFSNKNVDGQVSVDEVQMLTPDWMKEKTLWTYGVLNRISRSINSIILDLK